jgi:hypothetical protein
LITASYVLWAAARLGYGGPLQSHRGYNVADEAVTLDGDIYERSKYMLGFFEACYWGCAPCGTSCTTLDATHEVWLRRQYAVTRQLGTGQLANAVGCLIVDGGVTVGDCAVGSSLVLEPGGHLMADSGCLASTAEGDVVVEPCATDPAQYWLFDDEGNLFNGRMPDVSGDMAYNHVRCLGPDARAVTCGADLQSHWQFQGTL